MIPMLDPARAGLTNTGQLSAVARIHRGGRVARPLTVGDHGIRADRAARPTASRTFMRCLSIITAEAATPEPT